MTKDFLRFHYVNAYKIKFTLVEFLIKVPVKIIVLLGLFGH